MADSARDFHIGDILSITHDRLVSPRHMEGVYDILNFMTGDSLFTHQLPRAARECTPFLLEQHPALVEVDVDSVDGDRWQDWLNEQADKYGETLPVKPLPKDAHEFIDPLSELAEKVHPDRIVVVDLGKADG